MNAAWTYKQHLRMSRTYIIALAGAALVFVGLGGLGLERGMEYEEEVRQEEQLTHNVPYEPYFREAAPIANTDWELLAAIAYHESRFNEKARSKQGAAGIMQLMPRNAYRYGLNDSTMFCAEDNITAGAKSIRKLQDLFYFVPDSAQRIRFAVAAYNAGPAHILDGRRLAQKHGGNPNDWESTAYWLGKLREEAYYSDSSVVKFGRFNSSQTVAYVRHTMQTCEKIRRGEEMPLRGKKEPSPTPSAEEAE